MRLEEDMDVLAEMLKSDNADVRREALSNLRSHGAKSVGLLPELIAALKDPSPVVREEAASDLAGIAYCAPKEAVPHLVRALDDPSVQGPVVAALEAIGEPGEAALAEWKRRR